MMLVLPVQTFASAAMLGCAFSHPNMDTQPALDTQTVSGTATASCHESERTEQAPGTQPCKHCTACYLASAMWAPAADVTSLLRATQSVITYADKAFTGFIPDSLERPPRIRFA